MAAQADPTNLKRRLRLGLAESAAGNVKEARAALEEVLKLSPDSKEAVAARGILEKLKAAQEKAPRGENGAEKIK